MNDPLAAIQAHLATQAPRSLRNLFEDPNASNINVMGNVLQTPDLNGLSRSPSPSPFRSMGLSIQPTDFADAPTPRPTHPRARHGTPVSRGPTPSSAQSPSSTSPDSPPKVLTYRDIRVNRGVLNIAIPNPEPPTPVLQTEHHNDDREHANMLSSPESDPDASQHSPTLRLPPAGIRSTSHLELELPVPVPKLPPPVAVAFPTVGPPSPIPPSIPAAPVATQDGSVPARHQAKSPSNPRIIRSFTSGPQGLPLNDDPGVLASRPGTSLPKHPIITRQASVAVMESTTPRTETGTTEVRPPQTVAPPPSHSILKTGGTGRPSLSKGYRSDPEVDKGGVLSKTVKPLKPVAAINLKDVLNVSPPLTWICTHIKN